MAAFLRNGFTTIQTVCRQTPRRQRSTL